MAVFAIPNPKKILNVDFPLDRVKESVKNITLLNSKYRIHSSNEIFNQYTYESYEFLSLGVYIDINLNSMSENKTEITVEIRRKMGTFNESHEVTHANQHIVNIVNYIAKLTVMSADEMIKLKSQQVQNITAPIKSRKEKNIAAILSFFVGGLGIHRFYLGQTLMGVFYLIFCWTLIPAFIAFIDFFAFIFMSQNKFDLKYNR
ncbi:TM2 domain-containing protein [Chryseobacterium vrystaatense]|uniref:TM2 domain-containing membrane protein YozV n=1 Tax=Chryseobacterium vrystaatense TaxID=307480 RepID=A0A1M4TXW2_9FLAO|nr:TM2 domain-containing protein [Chryseobacterium vrystaatense]SHE49286.1 TM2 domain-containing membrane protein YozV [Chryseobacterium vrystaatense]